MPELKDFRSTPAPETTFYVYDDLRAWQKGTIDHIFRFDTLDEAIRKWKELPDGLTPALGLSFREHHEVDLVQKNCNEAFLVSDYFKVDFMKDVPNHEAYLHKLIHDLNLTFKSEHSLFGNLPGSVLIPIHEGEIDESLLKHKILNPSHEAYPVSAISEFYAEGLGWVDYETIKTASEINFDGKEENRKPKITKLAVSYVEKDNDTGRIKNAGCMDISVASYRHLLEKNMQKEKTDLHSQIAKASKQAATRFHAASEKAVDKTDIYPEHGGGKGR